MKYEISESDPEGIQFVLYFEHKKKFSWEEFRDIAENAFLYAFKKEEEKTGCHCGSSADISYIAEFLTSRGFTFPNERDVVHYELEPFWTLDKVHSPELRKHLEREDKK